MSPAIVSFILKTQRPREALPARGRLMVYSLYVGTGSALSQQISPRADGLKKPNQKEKLKKLKNVKKCMYENFPAIEGCYTCSAMKVIQTILLGKKIFLNKNNFCIDSYKPSRYNCSRIAQIAQSVEQRTENPRVGGSIPSLGTIKY